MKTRMKILALFFLLFSGTFIIPEKTSAQHFSINFQVFYDELSPYGSWIYHPAYGHVWLPDVSPGFYPYATNGYWVFTEDGWTWVSLYPWGWAPFHYGRWYIDPLWGPLWIPGYDWSPGWVVWRSSGDYCGWAPLGPGVSLHLALGGGYTVPSHHWRFVRYRDFGSHDIYNYYVRPQNNITIINQTTIINDVRINNYGNENYAAGPSGKEVASRTGRNISPVVVKSRTKPGQNYDGRQMEVYRPRVDKYNDQGQKPQPSKSVKWNELNSKSEKHAVAPAKDNAPLHTRQKPPSMQSPAVKPGKETPKYEKNTQVKQSQPAKSTGKSTAPASKYEKNTQVKQSQPAKSTGKSTAPQVKQSQPAKSTGKSTAPQVKQQKGKSSSVQDNKKGK